METPVIPVESEATAPQALTADIKQAWDRGEVPAVQPKKEADSAAASSSEKKTEQPAPKGESAAESGAAPKQEKSEDKDTARDRILELKGEVKRLQAQVAEMSKPKAEAKAESAKAPETPRRPNPFKWTGTPEEYEEAVEKWEAHQKELAVADFQRQQFQQQAQQKNADMLKKTVEKYPDAEPKIRQTATDLVQKAPQFIQLFVSESDVLTDLLYTLSDPTTLQNVLDTAKANPSKAIRALRDMELDIQKAVAKPKEPEPEAKAKPEEKSPEKPKPSAPKPPAEVGGRGTAPEDVAASRVAANDYRGAKAEWDRRFLATAK